MTVIIKNSKCKTCKQEKENLHFNTKECWNCCGCLFKNGNKKKCLADG